MAGLSVGWAVVVLHWCDSVDTLHATSDECRGCGLHTSTSAKSGTGRSREQWSHCVSTLTGTRRAQPLERVKPSPLPLDQPASLPSHSASSSALPTRLCPSTPWRTGTRWPLCPAQFVTTSPLTVALFCRVSELRQLRFTDQTIWRRYKRGRVFNVADFRGDKVTVIGDSDLSIAIKAVSRADPEQR